MFDSLFAPLGKDLADAVYDGCTDRNAAHDVVMRTRFEARVGGFAIGILVGLAAGVAGAAYLHMKSSGGE